MMTQQLFAAACRVTPSLSSKLGSMSMFGSQIFTCRPLLYHVNLWKHGVLKQPLVIEHIPTVCLLWIMCWDRAFSYFPLPRSSTGYLIHPASGYIASDWTTFRGGAYSRTYQPEQYIRIPGPKATMQDALKSWTPARYDISAVLRCQMKSGQRLLLETSCYQRRP